MLQVVGVLIFVILAVGVDAFSCTKSGSVSREPISVKCQSKGKFGAREDDIEQREVLKYDGDAMGRRTMIASTIAVSGGIVALHSPVANANGIDANQDFEVDLSCLKDLPPISEDCIRIFLCRHGQTENNRLRIVQGARVDPPVNINGNAQATNLGLALANSDPQPKLFFSSPLLRAKMTAEIAANPYQESSKASTITPQQLSVLAEVDFGAVADGQPISVVQEKMTKTYTKWSMGDVDYRPEGGGDSGREVLIRACNAIETLVKEAESANVPCVVAVTHSAYLRVLVGMVLDEPLLKSSMRKIRNGSITVLDVPKSLPSTAIGPKPNLLGGWLSRKPSDFSLSIPTCKVIRVNETRHLPLDVLK